MKIILRSIAILLLFFLSRVTYADDTATQSTSGQQDQANGTDELSESSAVGFATNMEGELEGHPKGIWPHKLPFLAQKVLDRGFDLPPPYGIAGIFSNTRQDLFLSDLRVSFGDSDQPLTPVPFVTFETSWVETNNYDLKLDAWLLPFLDVFLIGGTVASKGGVIPIVVPGADALKVVAPSVGALCDSKPPGSPLRPEACDKDFVLLDEPNYTGNVMGIGVALPIGWKNFFAAVPMSYTLTNTTNSKGMIKAFEASLRLGGHFKPKHTGQVALYMGATYLNTEQDVFGVLKFDPDSPGFDEIEINYLIHQQPANKWNYLAGFNWVITKHWWLQAELGFGESRNNFIGSLTYRW
jgi:hypothetical protein